jgi:hypothetical protein
VSASGGATGWRARTKKVNMVRLERGTFKSTAVGRIPVGSVPPDQPHGAQSKANMVRLERETFKSTAVGRIPVGSVPPDQPHGAQSKANMVRLERETFKSTAVGRILAGSVPPDQPHGAQSKGKFGAGGGTRTRTAKGLGILSPVCLPIPSRPQGAAWPQSPASLAMGGTNE